MPGGPFYEPGDVLELAPLPYDFWAGPSGTGTPMFPGGVPYSEEGLQERAGLHGWQWGRWKTNPEVDRQVEALGHPELSWTYFISQQNAVNGNHEWETQPVWYRFVAGTVASTVPPDPPKPPEALPVLSSADATWGQVIPESFGLRRINGVPIWLGKVSRIADTGFVGAVDFAVAFGKTARPADDLRLIQLNRLWANGVLVYDALTSGAPIVQTGMTITFYPGSPDAFPDPTIQAAMGSATPAFRGLIYAVIHGFPLKSGDSSVPHIRAELADAPAFIAPSLTPFTVLDPPTAIDSHGMLMNFDTGTLYGLSHPNSLPHNIHTYDASSATELSNVELDGSLLTNSLVDPPNQYDIIFDDFLQIFDKYNNMVHWQAASSLSNTVRIDSFRVDLGRMVASYGNEATFTTSSGINTVTFMRCGELMRFRAFGTTIHGLLLGSLAFDEVVVLTYRTAVAQASAQNSAVLDRAGILVPGTSFNLGFEKRLATNHLPLAVYAYPVMDRPELIALYQVDKRDHQDAIGLYADGTQLFAFQGGLQGVAAAPTQGSVGTGATPSNPPMSTDVSSIEWVDTIEPRALFDFGTLKPQVIFGDPTTGCVMVIALGAGADGKLYKLQPSWILTNTGATLTALTQVYATDITDIDPFTLANSIRNSRLDAGSFAYLTSTQVRVISLATGQEIYRQSISVNAVTTFVYDSVYQTVYAPQNSNSPNIPTKVNLRAGTSALVPVTDFLTWSGRKLGYPVGDISSDPTITETVIGGNITTPVSARMAMNTVATMYGVSTVEIGGKLAFTRPQQGEAATLQAVFTKEDLSRRTESEHDSLATTPLAGNELPATIEVGHLDPANDYNASTQVYRRVNFPFQTAKTQGTTKFEAPIVINASDALTIAGRLALAAYGQSTTYEYRLPHRYVNLTPSDVIGFLDDDNVTISELSQISQIQYNGDWSLTMKGVRWSLSNTLVITADAPPGRQAQQMQGPSDSIAFGFDVPLLDPNDIVPGSAVVYTGVGSLGQSWWDAAQLSRALDSATVPLYITDISIPWGQVAEALPPSEALGTTFKTDNDTVMDVVGKSLTSSMIKTVTAEECRAGYNAALVGQPGRWELIYFQTVTVLSERRMQLSGILRGRRGTNINCDNHDAGDQIIIVRSLNAKTNLIGDNLSTLNRGKPLSYYAVGTRTHRPALPTTFTFQGASEKPWTVRRIRATLGSHVNAVNATSYSNECGQGNRQELIEVRANYHFVDGSGNDGGLAPFFRGQDWSPSNLIDGHDTNGQATATNVVGGVTNLQFIFDFHHSGFKQIIDEFTWSQSAPTSIGTYDWEASDDGVTWTTLKSGFDLTSGGGVQSYTNTTSYWFYRLTQTGGTTPAYPLNPWLREITFKCKADAGANDILVTWLRRDRLKPAAVFVTDDQPMTEAAEFYSVDILTPAVGPLRTLPLASSPRAVYSAADQATDGFTPPLLNLTVRVAQLGVGTTDADKAGFSKAKTVEVT